MNDETIPVPAHAAAIEAITGEALAERVAAVRAEVAKAFIGQPEVLDQILIALLAGGHVLIEGVPGLGKTLLVRALAQALELNYARVQFTSDLMPSDVSGHAVYDPKTESFKIRRGPVFTNLLLADEINRAPAKTQSALLEVMQEGQVTIEGKPFELSPPFLTLANSACKASSGDCPSICSSGAKVMRWRNAGLAISRTSSGVTKSRPCSTACARAARTSAMLPRGPAPSEMPGHFRVAATMRTA